MKKVFFTFIISILVLLNLQRSNAQHILKTKFSDLSIELETENLKINTHFKLPSTTPAIPSQDKWSHMNSSGREMILGGELGVLRTDLYISGRGRIERQVWTSEKKDLIAFRHIFTNTSGEDVQLNYMYPFYLKGEQKLFSGPQSYLLLTQKTLKNGRPEIIAPNAGDQVISDPFILIKDPAIEGLNNLLIGSQTYYHHLFNLKIDYKVEDEKIELKSLTAECDFEGVVVPDRGSRTSQWIVLAPGNDDYELITSYASRLADYHSVREPVERPYSVYCTWYYHADKYNEEYFKSDVKAFTENHMPFDVFLIDECWALDDWGDFEANDLFPSGMKWVADQIRSIGYIPGIWTPPYLVDPGTDLADLHPEWLLRNSHGELCTFFMNKRDHYILDTTHPGAADYLEEVYRKLARDWGYKYFKFDFMRAIFVDSDQQFYDKTATSLEAYRKGLEAIRRGVGEDSYISVCGGHYGASIGIANSQRSGSDVKSFWAEGEIPKYRQNLLRTWMSEFWHVDPDAMMVRRQEKALPTDERELTLGLFTDEEAFTNALNQFVGGGLVSFTEDFAIIDEDRRALYRHVIPSVNSSSEPLDLFNPSIPELMITHINPVCNDLDDWKILSIMNWSENQNSYELVLDDKMLEDLRGNKFLIYDFKAREVLAYLSKGDVFRVDKIPPHHSRVYKIMPWDGNDIAFVGTDLHFSSGGIEIAELKKQDHRLSGILNTQWGYPVDITYVVPGNGDESFSQKKITVGPFQSRFFLD